MKNKIKTLYVIHHSHTDIGYTDLQEKVISLQESYLYEVLKIMKKAPYSNDFRWNCETYFCVEEFLKNAGEAEKAEFFQLIKEEKIGLSATYLNFTDLLDSSICKERLNEMTVLFNSHGITPKTAMFADINGISMGQRDALLANGIEFLYTNIHTHHGMYPLYQNQTPFWWENKEGKRLLVWNGEHYNLGNVLGIRPNRAGNFMTQNYVGNSADYSDPASLLHDNLINYANLCLENGYNYDFLIASVSGVFSDNAPPCTEIADNIRAYNEAYGDELIIRMVSLQELYEAIREKISNAPVYQGDMTDWWASGIGSTPYAVKHYREAQHMYQLCQRLDPAVRQHYPEKFRTAQDNLLLYAEHTWGHSATIIDPYDSMVLNLDIRKNSYASKAHESTALILNQIARSQGDIMNYYNTNGRICVHNPALCSGTYPVEFYLESSIMRNVRITNAATGEVLSSQLSPHPRGVRISFVDSFKAGEKKDYLYEELPAQEPVLNSRKAYVGAERIRDIINDYEPFTYRIPYEFENSWFYLSYEPYAGIKEFRNKKTGESLLKKDTIPFFTPVYEVTRVQEETGESFGNEPGKNGEKERRNLGRNIRGQHSVATPGTLTQIKCREHGEVFTLLEFVYTLPGTLHCSVYVKFYEAAPKIDFKLRIAKTLSEDIESIYMPMSLELPNRELYLKKGSEAFRPGVDQLPGTCMEYYMTDTGILMTSDQGSAALELLDTPLVTMGPLKHHPIRLCDGNTKNNQREIYSWVMNNLWETNFKMDLSGFSEFRYSLHLFEETDPEAAFLKMEEVSFHPNVIIVE